MVSYQTPSPVGTYMLVYTHTHTTQTHYQFMFLVEQSLLLVTGEVWLSHGNTILLLGMYPNWANEKWARYSTWANEKHES